MAKTEQNKRSPADASGNL